ncbi:MAG: DUF3631 domain-containing protein, partial [Gammaproteobacteria bacterium]
VIERLLSGVGLEDDSPWGDLHGKPLGKRGLASMLSKYAVRPVKVNVQGVSLQGYRREHLWDAWVRYLPSLDAARPEHPEPSAFSAEKSVPDVPDVPEIQRGEGAKAHSVNGVASDAELF